MPAGWAQQSQAQGGQLCPAAQAGQAHPHPPVPPGTGCIWTQVPLGHGAAMQTTPSSIQVHDLAVSARQLAESACPAQVGASDAGGTSPIFVGVVPLEPSPLTPTPPAPHAQSQGGQAAPGAQVGQAQVQVPPPVEPVTPPPHEPAPQSQVQGGQVSPGAQAAQVQVQVPPPPLPGVGFEQSHSTAGQSALAGHAIGCTQVQPPPEASRAWQYPPASQVWPAGQRSIDADASRTPDHAQRASASHPALSVKAAQESIVMQTPAGQVAPAGHADSTARHSQPALAAQASAPAFTAHVSFTNAAGTTLLLDCV